VAPEPLLRLGRIQGNSVAGFRQDHQAFVFGRITRAPAFREWLAAVVPTISTARQVLDHNARFRELRDAAGSEPAELVATWRNIAFSAAGLRRLVGARPVAAFLDDAFREGMPVRSGLLGDPHEGPGSPARWRFGGTAATEPHLVVTVASDDAGIRDREVERLVAGARGWRPVWVQPGDNLPGAMAGHEHFGFRDGISQPGLRGRGSRGPGDLVTPRDPGLPRPLRSRFARSGQPLLWPGQVVLGAPAQNPLDPVRPAPRRPLPGPPWCRDGSFLVIRRLRQDVAGFWALARRVGRATGRDPIAAAARLVGRWPGGAPLVTSPDRDDPAQERRNDFVYEATDPDGARCPFAAHIRKVNPRDVTPEQGGASDTLTRLMLRRGIAYGPPTAAEPWRLRRDDGVDRGLVFAAQMASIVDQFEFLPQNWTNDPLQPEGGGHDPLIGQEDAGARRRFVEMPRASDGAPVRIRIDREVVVPTGGGYFFAPSTAALAGVLSRTP
jgi:Dyp-type peroxidase family